MAPSVVLEKYKQLSDTDLIHIFRDGDDHAASVLIDRYLVLLKITIAKLISDKYTQEDMLQDLMEKVIRILRSGNKYVDEGFFGAWVKRVCHNMCVDFLRNQKSRPATSYDSEPFLVNRLSARDQNAEQIMIRKEEYQKLWRCINLLPDNQRDIIIFRYFYEMPFHEIAEYKGMNINTTVGRMHYAHKRLLELMNEK